MARSNIVILRGQALPKWSATITWDDPTPGYTTYYEIEWWLNSGEATLRSNIAASLSNIAATYEFVPSDRSYLVMPLFHVHGLMAGLLSPLSAGAAVILPKEGKFSASVFWKDCCDFGATFYTAVPTMHQVGEACRLWACRLWACRLWARTRGLKKLMGERSLGRMGN
jgi:hypothetical protein